MSYTVERVTDHVYALLRWDETWQSYNNSYLIQDREQFILIDAGKAEHAQELGEALAQVGCPLEAIGLFIATHGHRDHIGGALGLPNADKFIHPLDLDLLQDDWRAQFRTDLTASSVTRHFDVHHLGDHTWGSIALYHRASRILFVGDHYCFFGDELPDEQVVACAVRMGDLLEPYRPEMSGEEQRTTRYELAAFNQELSDIARIPAAFLCTGHGVVLHGDIQSFLQRGASMDDNEVLSYVMR
ncbi:glyoxylase-like metal-dependent hydrolase (beta-lactamase superfamily II) [Paenibacillus phyllosphaerae]|uniref:Glyoxylase-like metal-dependent hydrolase (Beta-lactamase superfamily II) n=1 Tax=Paenibacillus phyllosphaerae TaxID=274593 RepID=A0A7W5FMD6_9BACL|nr:MBL fold metallo-hydrolase [Paenibacillus phyllosphaerae]MBB3110170.1 glyoxylase-like metal-dependent hydrolase (beta-lactamase superfamily II) [Paenibacillus phyllosphaerae]